MMQLFDSTAKLDMVPGYVNKITVNGESRKLDGWEMFEYKQIRGKLYSDCVPILLKEKWYNELDDEVKVEVLNAFKEFADKSTKKELHNDYNINSKAIERIIDKGYRMSDILDYLEDNSKKAKGKTNK